ncbi:putative NUDIX hydrolase [compost metagenome]
MVEALRRLLAERQGLRTERPGLVPSAVLVPVLVSAEGLSLLYTKRSEALNHHRGQISFPGGKWSPEDPTLLDTALREADEEVGLDPCDVEVLGELDEVWTPTGFTILPYVGLIRAPYSFRINPGEIDRLIEVPWERIPAAGAFDCEMRRVNDEPLEICRFAVNEDVIWGATARITRNLMALFEPVNKGIIG